MLMDLWVSRAWRVDLDRHARFACAMGRLRRRVFGMFAARPRP